MLRPRGLLALQLFLVMVVIAGVVQVARSILAGRLAGDALLFTVSSAGCVVWSIVSPRSFMAGADERPLPPTWSTGGEEPSRRAALAPVAVRGASLAFVAWLMLCAGPFSLVEALLGGVLFGLLGAIAALVEARAARSASLGVHVAGALLAGLLIALAGLGAHLQAVFARGALYAGPGEGHVDVEQALLNMQLVTLEMLGLLLWASAGAALSSIRPGTAALGTIAAGLATGLLLLAAPTQADPHMPSWFTVLIGALGGGSLCILLIGVAAFARWAGERLGGAPATSVRP